MDENDGETGEKENSVCQGHQVSQGIVFDDRVFDPMDVCIGANTFVRAESEGSFDACTDDHTKDVKQLNIFNQY